MKLTTGSYKFKSLSTIKNKKLRPTPSKVRQAIFNVLLHRFNFTEKLDFINVLEPFAGTGSISIEAISRGANKATLIEKDLLIFNLLKKNISKLKLNDIIELKNIDFFKMDPKEKHNFIYIDPPFHENLTNLTLEKIFDENFCCKKYIVICETEKSFNFSNVFLQKISFERDYGGLKITIISNI